MTEEFKSVLDEARGIVLGDRQSCYGHPIRDFTCTAELFTSILKRRGVLKEGTRIEAHDIPLLMIAVKISRECNKHKLDNLVDIAGYAETLNMVYDAIGRLA